MAGQQQQIASLSERVKMVEASKTDSTTGLVVDSSKFLVQNLKKMVSCKFVSPFMDLLTK